MDNESGDDETKELREFTTSTNKMAIAAIIFHYKLHVIHTAKVTHVEHIKRIKLYILLLFRTIQYSLNNFHYTTLQQLVICEQGKRNNLYTQCKHEYIIT